MNNSSNEDRIPEASDDQPSGLNMKDVIDGKFTKDENGNLNVMASIGGWRGIIESFLPSVAFLVTFILSNELLWSSVGALGTSVILGILRKIAGGSMTQVLAGMVGVGVCVFVAMQTGEARGYYLYGLITNAIFAPVLLISMAVRWPLIGFLYGLLRNEPASQWRTDKHRFRLYQWATLVVAAVPILRLIFQVPMYLADNIAALGITRLVMGLPLYGAALWLAWLMTTPKTDGELK